MGDAPAGAAASQHPDGTNAGNQSSLRMGIVRGLRKFCMMKFEHSLDPLGDHEGSAASLPCRHVNALVFCIMAYWHMAFWAAWLED